MRKMKEYVEADNYCLNLEKQSQKTVSNAMFDYQIQMKMIQTRKNLSDNN